MSTLPVFTSVFTDTGENLALDPKMGAEKRSLLLTAPRWARATRPGLILLNRFRRALANREYPRQFEYALYTRQSPGRRVLKQVRQSTIRWRTHLTDNIPT